MLTKIQINLCKTIDQIIKIKEVNILYEILRWSENYYLEMVKFFIENGANIYIKNDYVF